nr:MAG TPA: hypothetical protein [Caudoviricetes sp.]
MAKKKVTPTEGEELQPTDPITPTSPEETGSEPTPTEEAPNEDAAEEPVEGADPPPVTEETPTEEEGAPEDAEMDEAAEAEDTQEDEAPEAEDVAPTALSDLAAQILRDHDLKVVFLTSDGTAFYGYSDAQNYAQTLTVKDVYHFFATPPTDDELRELLPPSLRPNHLQA